ncbi:MAG: hypothetical protein ABUL72_00630 [Armatimonadota bacterium]
MSDWRAVLGISQEEMSIIQSNAELIGQAAEQVTPTGSGKGMFNPAAVG